MFTSSESPYAHPAASLVPSPEVDDRRRERRLDFSVEVNGEAGHQFFTGFTENISSGGLFISTYQTLPIGACLRVAFRIPSVDHDFECTAQVRWVREPQEGPGPGPGMGVVFLDLTTADLAVINAVLRRLETLFYDP